MVRLILPMLACAALAACASERFAQGGPEATTGSATQAPAQPPPDMAGRWTLSSGRGQCSMSFNVRAGASEGTIAPEGGCPGEFFTSRKFSLERSSLVIRNHKDEPLAQFSLLDPRSFHGKSNNGEPVTLSR